jgi:hypothetical protein
MRKCPPGSLKADSRRVLIQRNTVVLLTPHRLATKPTEINSGVHSSYTFGKLTSRRRYRSAGDFELKLSAHVVLAVFATFEVYENRVTALSQSISRCLQEYHNLPSEIRNYTGAFGENMANTVMPVLMAAMPVMSRGVNFGNSLVWGARVSGM